jgi:hypothetical protein
MSEVSTSVSHFILTDLSRSQRFQLPSRKTYERVYPDTREALVGDKKTIKGFVIG